MDGRGTEDKGEIGAVRRAFFTTCGAAPTVGEGEDLGGSGSPGSPQDRAAEVQGRVTGMTRVGAELVSLNLRWLPEGRGWEKSPLTAVDEEEGAWSQLTDALGVPPEFERASDLLSLRRSCHGRASTQASVGSPLPVTRKGGGGARKDRGWREEQEVTVEAGPDLERGVALGTNEGEKDLRSEHVEENLDKGVDDENGPESNEDEEELERRKRRRLGLG